MGDYEIKYGLQEVARAINNLASAKQNEADALAKIARQYERQLDEQYGRVR